MKPPIASPNPPPTLPSDLSNSFWPLSDEISIPEEDVRVVYDNDLSWAGMIRFTFKQFFSVPVYWVTAPFLLLLLPLILPTTLLFNRAMLKARGLSVTALTREGVSDVGAIMSYSIPWKRILFVFDWNGDVSIVTFGGGSVVPREAFASREEAREFTQIARELRQSRGQIWRDEWKAKTFGLSPENAPPNLPK